MLLYQEHIDALNAPGKEQRLQALRSLKELHGAGALKSPEPTENVNNHIHTIYSFSPYSPAKAVYMAWQNGLTTAGIMDHDSIAGAEEFISAGKIIGIATTVGFECRCSMEGTPLAGRRINNPDQKSVAYLAMHGIPHQHIGRVDAFLRPYREKRNARNRKMVQNLNAILSPCGLVMDFDRDILPISCYHEGGSVTERHILYALAGKLEEAAGRGEPLLRFLEERLGITVTGSSREKLADEANDMYRYYLLGVLKSRLVERFYVDAAEECPHVTDFLRLAEETGAVSAYAYLGDVGDSVTGDKKTQRFEDSYLEELVEYLSAAGFRALTYMPTRNTAGQLRQVMDLCDQHGLFQISGEDINSPFQSFVCAALRQPEFRHLITATWALIGHELAATNDQSDGMFSPETLKKTPGLQQRTAYYSELGRQLAEKEGARI